MEQSLYKEQYTLGRILSQTWKLFTANFKFILSIILIVYIPVNIILSFIPIEALSSDNPTEAFSAYIKIIQLTEGIFGIVATMAIAYGIGKILKREKVYYKEALKEAVHFWPTAIGTGLMEALFLLGLTLLLIIPGIIYGVYWSFSIFAIVFHRKSFMEALRYSKEVVQGRWWRVLGILFVFGILSLLAGLIVAIPFAFLPDYFFVNIISDTAIDIVTSFFTVATVVFFINLDHVRSAQKVERKTA